MDPDQPLLCSRAKLSRCTNITQRGLSVRLPVTFDNTWKKTMNSHSLQIQTKDLTQQAQSIRTGKIQQKADVCELLSFGIAEI